MYPEYYALVTAMTKASAGETAVGGDTGRSADEPSAQPVATAASTLASTALLGGKYIALPDSTLAAVHADGRCELTTAPSRAAEAARVTVLAGVDAVAVLVGSTPDLSFLPPAVLEALEKAGPPSEFSADGVKATHPVFIDVEPFTMEAKAVPTLHALGPLRGDNFARFAIHDGHGVADAIRARLQGGEACAANGTGSG